MSKFASLISVSIVAATLAACASTKPAEVCKFPGTTEDAPLWVCDAPVEGVAVSAVGSAEKSPAGLEFTKQMAATAARVRLAQTMRVRVQNMIKQYAESTGAGNKETVDRVNTSVTKQITDESLVGTKMVRSAQAPDGTMFVLVGLDEVAAQKMTETAVKTSLNNEQAAWQQFKAQKGQDELATDIAKQKVEQK